MSPVKVADHLTHDWAAVAHHEAGHALTHVLRDLPLHSAELRVARSWLGGEQVRGLVLWTRSGGAWLPDGVAEPYVLSCLTGPAAEAVWTHRTGGVSLRVALRETYTDCRDDMDAARRMCRAAGLDLRRAQDDAADLVQRHWASVVAVADALAERGRLSGDDIRRLVR